MKNVIKFLDSSNNLTLVQATTQRTSLICLYDIVSGEKLYYEDSINASEKRNEILVAPNGRNYKRIEQISTALKSSNRITSVKTEELKKQTIKQ